MKHGNHDAMAKTATADALTAEPLRDACNYLYRFPVSIMRHTQALKFSTSAAAAAAAAPGRLLPAAFVLDVPPLLLLIMMIIMLLLLDGKCISLEKR